MHNLSSDESGTTHPSQPTIPTQASTQHPLIDHQYRCENNHINEIWSSVHPNSIGASISELSNRMRRYDSRRLFPVVMECESWSLDDIQEMVPQWSVDPLVNSGGTSSDLHLPTSSSAEDTLHKDTGKGKEKETGKGKEKEREKESLEESYTEEK
jgi:hypothetical protein